MANPKADYRFINPSAGRFHPGGRFGAHCPDHHMLLTLCLIISQAGSSAFHLTEARQTASIAFSK